MNNQAFSKIWIIVILVILVVGGILAWQYFEAPKEEVKTSEEMEKPALQCKLRITLEKIELLKGVSSSISVSGFQGSANEVSWRTANPNIASVNPTSGTQIMVKAQNVGSTQIIATDNAVGSSCKVSIPVEVKAPETAGPTNCETNLDCLITASQNCDPAFVINTITTDIFGVKQTTTSYLEIKGLEAGKCTFYIQTKKIDLTFPSEIPQEVVNQQKEIYGKLEGRDGTCKFNTDDLISMLNRWKVGAFSTEDWDVAECEGSYFSQQL